MERVPDAVRRAALRAFDEREPDAVVADLAHDWVPLPPDTASRHLEFRSEGHSIDVEVRDHCRGHLALRVRIHPDELVHVRVRHASRSSWRGPPVPVAREVRGDGGGELAPVRRGMVSLVCTTEGAQGCLTQTAWVRL